jgi:hypothetical protein
VHAIILPSATLQWLVAQASRQAIEVRDQVIGIAPEQLPRPALAIDTAAAGNSRRRALALPSRKTRAATR